MIPLFFFSWANENTTCDHVLFCSPVRGRVLPLSSRVKVLLPSTKCLNVLSDLIATIILRPCWNAIFSNCFVGWFDGPLLCLIDLAAAMSRRSPPPCVLSGIGVCFVLQQSHFLAEQLYPAKHRSAVKSCVWSCCWFWGWPVLVWVPTW